MLLHQVELRVPGKKSIQMKQKHLIWLKKYHLNSLQTKAKKSDICLNFVIEKNAVEIAGPSSALTGIERLIHSICPTEQNILLPFEAVPSNVTDFLSEYKCCFAYNPFKNSLLWIKETTGIIIYKGESGTDCLYSDVQVRAVESEGKDMVIEWLNDDKTALLKFPLWREGGIREKNQIEEVLNLLFTEVKKQNKKYVAFDLQNLVFWPMETCVKSIIDCVPEGLIIWISHPDENAFQTAINCLKEAEFTKTRRDLKSSKIELKVVKGRIAKLQEKVDVIVNTTSLSLDMTSGAVSASTLEAAGDGLKTEIAQIPADRTTGRVIRVNYGDVAETFGYRLNCERIFHGALYKWKDDQQKALDVLRQFVRNCISLADERKFKTLAFPAIGTGQLKIPAVLVASSVKSIVEEYAASKDHKHVEKILFVIHEKDEENFKVFWTILEHENAARKARETPEIPVLYRFSVYGEEQNVEGAMNILAGMFREHVNEKYKLAMSQEGETKDTNQQKDVHVQPVVKTNGFAISQSPATVSTAEENKFAISYAEQLCLLLQSKEKMVLTEKYLGPVLKDSNCENIICPFLEDECALIKFKTTIDADKFFGRFENEKYALRKLPIQAVTNIKAKLSSKVISVLKGKGITSEEFNRKTGAYLSTDNWTVEGSLLMVQNGERFIKELVVKECEASNFSTQNENRSSTSLDSTQDIDLSRKYSIKCSVYEEKALRELFTSTELPFSNVNIVDVIPGQKIISGTQKNVNPFEKALAELKCQEISEISLMEIQDFEKKKLENVSVSFDEKRQTMIIISRSPELLKRSIEEFRRLQDDLLCLTEEEFNFIIFSEKSLSQDFPKNDGKIMVKGPKSFVNKYRLALDNLKKYPVQSVTITDRVRSEAEIFISRFSRENKNVYIQMKDNKISITGKKTDKVLLAKQKIDEQIESMRKRHIGLASNGSDQNVKSGAPDVNLLSPKETDIVFQKSNVRVYVLKANILQVKADAIVNPMSTDLSHSILKEAGSSVQRQCSEILDSKRNNILQIGEVFVTDGGNLSHLLKIIHVNVPDWNNYAELEVGSPCEKCIEDIAETVKVSLEKGNDNNVFAIAIPPISKCGVGSVPLPVCGRAYVSAVTSYIDAYTKKSTHKIREIYFVDTDQTKLDAIKFAFSGFLHWVFHQADNEEHFYHGGGTVVKIFASEILFADAEALVAPQDGEMKSDRYIAKSLKRCECKAYAEEIAKFYGCTWRVGDIRTTSAPKSLKFYHILHVFSPSWRSDISLDVKIKDLRTCIQNVFKEASKFKLCTIAIPTFGGGIKENINKQKVFKETARAIVECLRGTPDCTVRVISIIDSNELNIALMILEFYKILSQDGKLHNTDFIDVQRPYLPMKETEFNLTGILV